MAWNQVYNPLNNPVLSTACAALPIFALPGGLAFFYRPRSDRHDRKRRLRGRSEG